MTNLKIPSTALSEVVWPALPAPRDAAVLALQYQFERSQWWPPETLLTLQLRQLEPLLAHAARTVPFYRDRLAAVAELAPGELTPEIWRRLPLLSRSAVQDAGPALISQRLPKDHAPTKDMRTSGSTGRPITVKSSAVTALFYRAINLRYHLWHDRNFSATAAGIRHLRGRMADAVAAGKPGRWVYGHPSGPIFFFDITRPVGEQLEWLVRRDPVYLLTFPTNLAALVRRSEDTGARPAKLREVATMGEVLDPAVRAACERVWGAPIHDAYSAQETGMIALQCPEHPHYHVQAESVLVEVLGEDDTPCGRGECGRLVITPLNNFATPLIRYEIGDYAEVGEPCPCGRGLPVLKRILGRVRNMITLPSGEQSFPRFRPLKLQEFTSLRQIQCIQRNVHEIEVKLVVRQPLTPAEEDRLRDRMRQTWGHPFAVHFVYVDEIPRSAGGKYEEFQSLVDR